MRSMNQEQSCTPNCQAIGIIVQFVVYIVTMAWQYGKRA